MAPKLKRMTSFKLEDNDGQWTTKILEKKYGSEWKLHEVRFLEHLVILRQILPCKKKSKYLYTSQHHEEK